MHWSHGGHEFNFSNENDIKKLNEWKEKSLISKSYKTAINVWTNKDKEKMNCAKENNLNYIILWNKNDMEEFYENYKKKKKRKHC